MLRRIGMWTYCYLRIFLYWLGKLSRSSTIGFRRWLSKGKERRTLANLGRQIHKLYQVGQEDWSKDIQVQEVLQALESRQRQAEEVQARRRELDDRFREQARRLKAEASLRPAKSDRDRNADSSEPEAEKPTS